MNQCSDISEVLALSAEDIRKELFRLGVTKTFTPDPLPLAPIVSIKRKRIICTKPLAFADARAFVHTLKLRSSAEWIAFWKTTKRPLWLPTKPDSSYPGDWVSWEDWLGAKPRPRQARIKWLPFEEARAFVRSLRLKHTLEWRKYAASIFRPKNIPSNPNDTYRDKGWIGWTDWIGRVPEDRWLSFYNAREFARSLGLWTERDWDEYWNMNPRPKNIPRNPYRVYRGKGWISWADWTGKALYGR